LIFGMRPSLKRLGLIGIAAFTLKGLLWLAVPAMLAVKSCARADPPPIVQPEGQ
jgi:hypothetical protein